MSYVCPQCGPDPAGAEIHAETHHTLPSGARDDHEEPRDAESAGTRIQAGAPHRLATTVSDAVDALPHREEAARNGTPCPDPDHGHGCYAKASEEGEHRRRNGCPPLCNCPPGTHTNGPQPVTADQARENLRRTSRFTTAPPETHPCPCGCGGEVDGAGTPEPHPWHTKPEPGITTTDITVDDSALKAAWNGIEGDDHEGFFIRNRVQVLAETRTPIDPRSITSVSTTFKTGPNRRGAILFAEPGLEVPYSNWTQDGKWQSEDGRDRPEGWEEGDEECAGCEVAVLAGADAIVGKWGDSDRATYWWHPGCWASLQRARAEAEAIGPHAVIAWPPERGLNDGKGLARAAGS